MNVYLPKLGLGPFCYSIVMDSSWETCPFFFVVVIVYSMHSVLFNLSSWIFVNQEFTLRHESRRQNIELCHWILNLAFNYIFQLRILLAGESWNIGYLLLFISITVIVNIKHYCTHCFLVVLRLIVNNDYSENSQWHLAKESTFHITQQINWFRLHVPELGSRIVLLWVFIWFSHSWTQ